eukprot:Filipodium_phascolosomae@DN2612_c0_g1_i3.p1
MTKFQMIFTLLTLALVAVNATTFADLGIITGFLTWKPFANDEIPLGMYLSNQGSTVLPAQRVRLTSTGKSPVHTNCPEPIEFPTPRMNGRFSWHAGTHCTIKFPDYQDYYHHVMELSNSNITDARSQFSMPHLFRPRYNGAHIEDMTISFDSERKRAGWLEFSFTATVDIPENTAMVLFQSVKQGWHLAPCRYRLPNRWVKGCVPHRDYLIMKEIKAGELVQFLIRMWRPDLMKKLELDVYFARMNLKTHFEGGQFAFTRKIDVSFPADQRRLRGSSSVEASSGETPLNVSVVADARTLIDSEQYAGTITANFVAPDDLPEGSVLVLQTNVNVAADCWDRVLKAPAMSCDKGEAEGQVRVYLGALESGKSYSVEVPIIIVVYSEREAKVDVELSGGGKHFNRVDAPFTGLGPDALDVKVKCDRAVSGESADCIVKIAPSTKVAVAGSYLSITSPTNKYYFSDCASGIEVTPTVDIPSGGKPKDPSDRLGIKNECTYGKYILSRDWSADYSQVFTLRGIPMGHNLSDDREHQISLNFLIQPFLFDEDKITHKAIDVPGPIVVDESIATTVPPTTAA